MKTENEIIAEFMGLVRHEADATYNLPQYYRPENDKRKKGSFVGYPEQLKYATSWDWLVPVVEKIRNTDHIYKTASSHFEIGVSDGIWWCALEDRFRFNSEISAIDAAYTCVVEFIKWYNSQPK